MEVRKERREREREKVEGRGWAEGGVLSVKSESADV